MKKHPKAIRVSVFLFFLSMIAMLVFYKCNPGYYEKLKSNEDEYLLDSLYAKNLDSSTVLFQKYNEFVAENLDVLPSSKSAGFRPNAARYEVGDTSYVIYKNGLITREIKKVMKRKK